ncbi:MAG: hypothetical protein RLY43_212 [Bacteroidota bacterium]|jgi:phage gpG-like protein
MDISYEYIKTALNSLGRIISYQLYVEIGSVLRGDTKGKLRTAPSNSNFLELGKGQLLQSWLPGKPNNINEVKFSDTSIEIKHGSNLPYAAIHEFGGKVSAKKKGKGGRTAMENYFWYLYKKTNIEYYKNLALRIAKKGFIEIPKREYLSKAVKEFDKNIIAVLEKHLDLEFSK